MIDTEQDKMLSYFHHLSQARQYADTKGQELIKQELKRIKAKYISPDEFEELKK